MPERISRPSRLRSITLGGILLGAMVCLLVPGCASDRKESPSDQIELGRGSGGGLNQRLADGSLGTIESDSTRGLEVRLWVVDDTQWDALRFLNDHADTQTNPITPEDRKRWADWGFRLVVLPMDEVDGFLGSLRSVQPKNIQWLGEFAAWRAVVRAGTLRSQTVRVGDGTREIEPGKPRLIARSWVEPELGDQHVVPMVRLDLGVQIETTRRQADIGLMGVDRARSIEDDGPVLDALLMSARFDGSQAVVLVGDAPDSDWDALPSVLPQSDAVDQGQGSDEDADAASFGPDEHEEQGENAESPSLSEPSRPSRVGSSKAGSRRSAMEPEVPQIKSLGEQMLTSAGSRLVRPNQSRQVPKRVVVVFVPRVEGGWSLLGELTSQSTQPGGRP